jgi:hypothetical protein
MKEKRKRQYTKGIRKQGRKEERKAIGEGKEGRQESHLLGHLGQFLLRVNDIFKTTPVNPM